MRHRATIPRPEYLGRVRRLAQEALRHYELADAQFSPRFRQEFQEWATGRAREFIAV